MFAHLIRHTLAAAAVAAAPAWAFNPQPDPPANLSYVSFDVGGAVDTFGNGINDRGVIAGYSDDGITLAHGYTLAGGALTSFDAPGAVNITEHYGINNRGLLGGAYYDGSALVGYLTSGSQFTRVAPGGPYTVAWGLDDAGTVVGRHDVNGADHGFVYGDASGQHGFLREDGVDYRIDIAGAAWTQVRGINDAGTMVGIWGDADGVRVHAFSAVAAVPEPGSWALFGAGLMALLGWRRRRAAPVAFGALLLASSVQAATDHWVQAWVDARGNGQSVQDNSGPIDGPVALAGPVGFSVSDAFGSYSSSIQAGATYGHLWGSAAAAQDSPIFTRQSDANADEVTFQDRLTLASAALAPGTAVQLSVTMVLDDDLSSGSSTCCANVAVSGRYAFVFAVGDQSGGGHPVKNHVVQTNPVTWFVGQPVDVGAILFFDVGSSPGCCTSTTGSSRVDLADAQFFVNLPPNVSLLSASGASYTPPVSEPGAWALSAAGLSLLLARQRLGRREV